VNVAAIEEVDHLDGTVTRHDDSRGALEAGRTEPVSFQRCGRSESFDGCDALAEAARLAIRESSTSHPEIVADCCLLVCCDGAEQRERDEREDNRDKELGNSNAHELTGVSADDGRPLLQRTGT
jgi:hypothetical protein